MGIQEYLYEKFVTSPGYTVEETVVYALILVGATWLTYEKLLKDRVSIDRLFVYALVPFIVLGALIRSVGDVARLGLISGPVGLLITPGIYFTAFVVTVIPLGVALALRDRIPYWKTMAGIGTVLSIAVASFLAGFVTNPGGMLLAAGIAILWIPVLCPLRRFTDYLSNENAAILWSHMLDASTTFTALAFTAGLTELHVLPSALMRGLGMGPSVMFLLKLAVVWPVLYYIDKDTDDPEYRTWLKLVVLILGLGLGIHNLFVIGIMGTS